MKTFKMTKVLNNILDFQVSNVGIFRMNSLALTLYSKPERYVSIVSHKHILAVLLALYLILSARVGRHKQTCLSI